MPRRCGHTPGPTPESRFRCTQSKTRRARGAGHLYTKRDKAGGESWIAKWYVDGRQVQRKVGPKRDRSGRGLDRAEAERKLRDLVHDVAQPVQSRVELEEAGHHLIDHRRALGRKPATVEAYDSLLRIHLGPFFAGRSLDAITPEDIEAFIRAKARDGKSAKTITTRSASCTPSSRTGSAGAGRRRTPVSWSRSRAPTPTPTSASSTPKNWRPRSGPRPKSATSLHRRWRRCIGRRR